MDITIKNVCNVKEGKIAIIPNGLNVYYGNNGIGKSSITKALKMYTDEYLSNPKLLKELIKEITPYDGSGNPEVSFVPDTKLKSMMIFNQDYIKKVLFQKKGLFSDTFNIVMKNDQTEILNQQINILVTNLRLSLGDFNEESSKWDDFEKRFCFTTKGLSNAKGTESAKVANGNPEKQIEIITPYATKIHYDGWAEWVEKGKNYIGEDSPNCPFCLNDNIDSKLDEINRILDILNTNDIDEHRKAVVFIKGALSCYLDDEKNDRLDEILDHPEKISDEEAFEIREYRDEISFEFNKINTLKQIGQVDFNKVEDIEELKESLEKSKLNVSFFGRAGIGDKASKLNSAIDELIISSTNLVNLLNKLNNELKNNVIENEEFINEFLQHAGMLYKIKVNKEGDRFETVLISTSADSIVSTPDTNLSFGEHNALALMLFTVDAIKRSPDYIVLDDPISSFDMNKKYALMYQIFGAGKNNLRGKTVLMFTHEFDVVIDTIKTKLFDVNSDYLAANAWYIYNKNGILDKKEICDRDIIGVAVKEKDLALDKSKSKIVRVLHIRRYEDITYPFNQDVNAVLSSFLHCLDYPEYLPRRIEKPNVKNVEEIIARIKGKPNGDEVKFDDFSYSSWIKEYNNKNKIKGDYDSTNSSYEKLVIARFYLNYLNKNNIIVDIKNRVFMSYLNAAYHIENESVSSLSEEFDIIPQYIIDECDEFMKSN